MQKNYKIAGRAEVLILKRPNNFKFNIKNTYYSKEKSFKKINHN